MSAIRSIGTTFEQGLRTPNYVNGRVLHAEDLRADQESILARLTNLGKSIGYGIVEGLMVRQTPNSNNSLQVDTGIGINRRGDIMQLAGRTATLSLVIEPETSFILDNAGLFQPCESATPGENVAIDTGAYLLTMSPVSRLEGSVPVNTAARRGNTVECAAKWVVEGLEFKAVRLTTFGNNGVDTSNNTNTRQNRLAHWVYGSNAHRMLNYLMGITPQSTLDRIGADLTSCDLPLGVFYWTSGAISFVDTWAARRRVSPVYPAPNWDALLGDERRAEGEARLLQFQEQLDRIQQTTANLVSVSANTIFEFLPPMGFLPIRMPADRIVPIQNIIRAIMAQFLAHSGTSLPIPGVIFPQTRQDIEEQLTNNFITRVVERLSTGGFDTSTFFGESRVRRINQVDPITVDKALVHSWHDQSISLTISSTLIDIYILSESLNRHVNAILLNIIDIEGFPSVSGVSTIPSPAGPIPIPFSVPGPQLSALWVQQGMRSETLAAVGPDANTILAKVKQPNTPLVNAAFVRVESEPEVIEPDND